MNESLAREEICRVGQSLFARGYVHGTAGNISMRLDDGGLLITPTDACLGWLDPAQLARLDADGRQTGGLPASKTAALHTRIHRAAGGFDPGTRCVIHTHSTHCVALSLRAAGEELLPALTPYFVMKVGRVPVIPYHRPGAPEAAEAVARAIERYGRAGRPLRAVMLARLGPNVWQASPAAAMAVLEELEETARLALLAPGTVPLDEPQIEELRQRFGARW
ncbi:class II aldolase/adducin family protein [Ramlibacter tataouinensis]|uniref:L-fuculose phosphate aldolase (L-fuculose-1-phosphate aldolase)-like protein n=1 Tax=Ramlibacter tataouinensis (strain ATCC BAA-407 / DSM 14655 / LMG 21543 / TTB310) TaxID=365046 RepID=F5Y336_RAMTT|nr:aldolase [Ramlibacter tataouinensis]AEG94916.1 L-fuculose phosphate aldolase (L-fuculose-1-phosphate aldolase)-like protein [Ramlibacter tataouinensis TTB310]